jgi:type IV pilus assembly protein PilW
MCRPASEPRRAMRRAVRGRARGVTLVELMVALAVGLVLVLAAGTAFLAARKLFDTQADVQQVHDTMRHARYVLQNVVRQAGYVDYAIDGGDGALAAAPADLAGLPVFGATRTSVAGTGDSAGVHGSDPAAANDSLRVRFFGRNMPDGDAVDTTTIDCLGQPVTGHARAWSFFYVARAADGEPELYCKRRAADADATERFHAQPIARGVERFKVVFGYDADGDSVPERWIDAQAIDETARATGVASAAAWRKVVAIRVGLVVRGARTQVDLADVPGARSILTPLGAAFAHDASFDPPADGRFRASTTFTVMLRNVLREPS